MMFRKLYSNWLFDHDSQRFHLRDESQGTHSPGHEIRVVTRDPILPVLGRMNDHLITFRFSFDGSVIRDLVPDEQESDDCLSLLRIEKPADIQLNPESILLEIRGGESASISKKSDHFLSIKDVASAVGILLRLKRFGTVFVYGTCDNQDYCITYDGEFFFHSGQKMKVVN